LYICKVCKRTQISFTTKCIHCFSFLSLEKIHQTANILTLDQIELKEIKKFKTPIDENLGDGLPQGSMTILAGIPGAGKSTLTLKIIQEILANETNIHCLYISSEEHPEMIKSRALRVAPELNHDDRFLIICETNLEIIKNTIKNIITSTLPQSAKAIPSGNAHLFIVLDSINAVKSNTSKSHPGSPSNIIKTLNTLQNIRNQTNRTTTLIIAHANKQRTIAGPLTLQHMVDIVLFFNIEKDNSRTLTTLKNRFGPSGVKTTLIPGYPPS